MSELTTNASFPLLSLLVWLPILGGAVCLLLGNTRAQAARWVALAFAAATLAASVLMFTGFDYGTAGMQFVERHAWIPTYDIRYDLGEGHPLLGRRVPDLDLVTVEGVRRVFSLLHGARPVLLDLGTAEDLDVAPWADRVQRVRAHVAGAWELPVLGEVTAPSAVLVRPDGHVAWVGDGTQSGLGDALTTWFGPARS